MEISAKTNKNPSTFIKKTRGKTNPCDRSPWQHSDLFAVCSENNPPLPPVFSRCNCSVKSFQETSSSALNCPLSRFTSTRMNRKWPLPSLLSPAPVSMIKQKGEAWAAGGERLYELDVSARRKKDDRSCSNSFIYIIIIINTCNGQR